MQFGPLLGKLRKQKKISQKELAAILGIDQSYLSKIEAGDRNPPPRDVIIEITNALSLTQEEIDQLLVAAKYSPLTLFDLGFDSNDHSLKKHIGILQEIKNKAPLASYLKAKEDIIDYLELLRAKYTQTINEELAKNTLLADYLYSKVRRGGLKALYEAVNRPLGGAIVVHQGKLLLHQIGVSPLKGLWHIPIGYVNPEKGDKTAKDIALRLVRRFLGAKVKLEIAKELTAEGEVLETLDTAEYSIKLGVFPAQAQIFEIRIKEKTQIKTFENAGFFKIEELPALKGDIHPLLYQIIKLYFKNKKVARKLYLRGEKTVEKILAKKDFYSEMSKLDKTRRRRT